VAASSNKSVKKRKIPPKDQQMTSSKDRIERATALLSQIQQKQQMLSDQTKV
jgi:hypothetical protein